MTLRLPLLLCCLVSLCACGGEDGTAVAPAPGSGLRPPPTWTRVPDLPWARVSTAQVEAAARMGAPVAFENDLGMRFVFVHEGTFAMGSPSEEPGRGDDESHHEVRLRFGYYVQTEPVTWTQYRAWPVGRLHPKVPADPHAAVTGVGPGHATAFGLWLSGRDLTWDYRLPTEAEWEYACRAGSTDAYPWGARPPGDASPYRTNAWGLRDMHAGVRELCADRYGPYPAWAVVDPRGPATGTGWVVRGAQRTDPRGPARSAHRGVVAFEASREDVGFRLVAPLGYGLGRYGSTEVTFRLVPARESGGPIEDDRAYDLRVIRMNERLAARVAGIDPEWTRVLRPGSPVTLTMVPGKYYVYAETARDGRVVRGLEIKFQVWDRSVQVPVPVPEADLSRYGSGTDRPR